MVTGSSLRVSILRFLSRKSHNEAVFAKRGFSETQQSHKQIPREKPAVKKRGVGAGGGIPLLIVPITTFALGTWQIKRRKWKLNLIEQLEQRMTATPISLPTDVNEVQGLEYRRVTVTGEFDHSRELYVGPRVNVHDNTMGSSRSRNLGVNVITPFKLSDRSETILVNRGHVNFQERPPQMRQEGQVTGEVKLTGVVRISEEKPTFEGDPAKDGFWLYTNVKELADVAETSPVLLDADINSTVPGGPVGGQTRVTLRNEHLSYIFTWYTLCAFSSFMWYRAYRRPVPHRAVLETIKRSHHKM